MTRPLIDILAAHIAEKPGRRIHVDALVRHATTADPTLLGDPSARTRLAEALTELATDGAIQLPKARNGWDDRTQPPLPRWIGKTMARPTVARPADRVWPQALERAAAIASRPDEHDLLERIALWLRDNPHPEPVPIEERSLEILDDEKALAALTTKRLFTSGALDLDLLACYPTPVPFPSQYVPGTGEPRLLVAENNATFHSLLTIARSLDPASRPNLHIGWGSGNQFPASITALTLLDPLPTAAYYFGDLDVAGLRIAANAAATAEQNNLPTLRPAAALYRWLLTHGAPRPDKSNTGITSPEPLTTWLPDELRPAAANLITTRQRIPQERLGLRALQADTNLLSQAVR
ncbi:Wadjet anti-phage system protein JetD domain-containing protein [Kitasatospora aureofaciens]|uniref:Wadjet anti-phage system protein JetD domain-containing protein n=1 Tax=Kitasatospora aureofaciens TaxID=1894 RepID=UPI0033EDA92C